MEWMGKKRERRQQKQFPSDLAGNSKTYGCLLVPLLHDKWPQNLVAQNHNNPFLIAIVSLGVGRAQLDNFCSESLASSEVFLIDWCRAPALRRLGHLGSLDIFLSFTWSLQHGSLVWTNFFQGSFQGPGPDWGSQMESVVSFLNQAQRSRESQRPTQFQGGDKQTPPPGETGIKESADVF